MPCFLLIKFDSLHIYNNKETHIDYKTLYLQIDSGYFFLQITNFRQNIGKILICLFVSPTLVTCNKLTKFQLSKEEIQLVISNFVFSKTPFLDPNLKNMY